MVPPDKPPADETAPGAGEPVREPPADGEGYAFRNPPPAWTDPSPVQPVKPITPRQAPARKSRWSGFWVLLACNLLVFVTSVCIMVLELTAARLVAKHVGNSLYTWTSVIGVVLAGITIGNYIGGWIADRFEPRRALPHLFLMSSILSLGVLWMDQVAAELERPAQFAWSTWVLMHVALVFLLPSLSLGTISPVVASLALSRTRHTGVTIGNVYAWGALGSIAGTFLTGFWLIDWFGTKAIVGMTAATLAIVAAIAAGGQRRLRAAVVLVWIPLVCLLGLAAAARVDLLAPLTGATSALSMADVGSSGTPADPAPDGWRGQLVDITGRLHKLGLKLGLRNDGETIYRDESNYSYIEIAQDDGDDEEPRRYLQLDKLIHSYYSPADPTRLHYEYEQVYAEVTQRVAAATAQTTSVPLPPFEGRDDLLARLPSEVTFDAEEDELIVSGVMSPALRDELLRLSGVGEYWCALQELAARTKQHDAGRLESITLEELPEGVTIPESVQALVLYDAASKLLTAFGPIGDGSYAELVAATPQAEFHETVQRLFRESRRIDTLFLGGGGFIFPRWIEANFASSSTIDVAEIDPAVLRAVQQELGLPPDDQTIIDTHIADARQFVDTLLQRNAALRNDGQPERTYDLIYGDAFNDFSVPWHLTTVEFDSKLQQLLKPDGVYLANIIDIFPRTEFPGGRAGTSEMEYRGHLPEGLDVDGLAIGGRKSAPWPFGSLEIRKKEKLLYDLRYEGVMSDDTLNKLCDLDQDDPVFQNRMVELYEATNRRLTYAGELPEALQTKLSGVRHSWLTSPSPFDYLQFMRLENDELVLSVRGALTAERRDGLLQLATNDQEWAAAVHGLYERSQSVRPGRFLARFTKTVAEVFSNVYVYSTSTRSPSDERDTFVVVCSRQPLDLFDSNRPAGQWDGWPFAWLEKDPDSGERSHHGEMAALLELSEGLVLEDDFAPVDNLMAPVFETQ